MGKSRKVKKMKVLVSHVWFFATLWTVVCQALCPWNSPAKNTGVGNHSLLQGIFPTQGSNQGILHCRQSEPLGKNTSEEENTWTRKNSVNETFKGEKFSERNFQGWKIQFQQGGGNRHLDPWRNQPSGLWRNKRTSKHGDDWNEHFKIGQQ